MNRQWQMVGTHHFCHFTPTAQMNSNISPALPAEGCRLVRQLHIEIKNNNKHIDFYFSFIFADCHQTGQYTNMNGKKWM